MGGTFDPVHNGHLRIAELAREEFGLDRVVFVPNGRPAHKALDGVSAMGMRLAMTELAVAANPHFTCSRIEIDRAGRSYAIDTVRGFRRMHPGLEALYFIVGADMAREIATWHQAEELVRECAFIAVTRPGYGSLEKMGTDCEAPLSFVSLLAAPGLEISGTALRALVRAGRSIRYLVPDAVADYIHAHGLYRDAEGA